MVKNEGVAIEKLILDVGGKKVELTVDQAKRLHGALAEMFGAKVEKHEHHHHDHDYPWTWPYRRLIWSSDSIKATFDAGTKTVNCSV